MTAEELAELLESVSLAAVQSMWLMHDEASAHFARDVKKLLDSNYSGRWIRRNWYCGLRDRRITGLPVPLHSTKGHCLLNESQHPGLASAFDWRRCDNNTRHGLKFSRIPGIFRCTVPFLHSDSRKAFSAPCKHLPNTKTLRWDLINLINKLLNTPLV
jgi:hypothetical protein